MSTTTPQCLVCDRDDRQVPLILAPSYLPQIKVKIWGRNL